MLESTCWSVDSFKTDYGQEHVVLIARVDPARLRIGQRATKKYRDLKTYEKLVPSGLGFMPKNNMKPQYLNILIERNLTLIMRWCVHLVSRDLLDAHIKLNPLTEVVSVGGRTGEDLFCVPTNMPYRNIDPQSRPSAILEEAFAWTNERRLFDFNDIKLNPKTGYLFLFMIMTNADGQGLTQEEQITRIVNIGKAIQKAPGSIALITIYESVLEELLTQSSPIEGITIDTTENAKITIGRHSPVELINGVDLIAALDAEGINHTYNQVTTNHLVDICNMFTARYNIIGNHLWEALAKGMVVIGLV